jgi:hypothetical protein
MHKHSGTRQWRGATMASAAPQGDPSRAFRSTPIFLADEDPAKLMRHAPPFGFKFGHGSKAFPLERLLGFQRNATTPARRKFSSCAVVGNSGTLRLRELGEEIDRHEAVLRINHAPAPHSAAGQKLVQYSGTRTTWRVVTSRWFDEERRDPAQRLLVLCDRPFVYSCQNLLFENGPKALAHNINPRFYARVREFMGASKIPLAGLVTTAIAMASCERVDTYGLSTMAHTDAGSHAPHVCGYYYSTTWASAAPAAAGQKGRGGGSGKGQGKLAWLRGPAGLRTDAEYHSRPGDAEFHDFGAHARALLAWNESGALRIRVR